MALPRLQKIVGTGNTSFTPDFRNKIGHERTYQLLNGPLIKNDQKAQIEQNINEARHSKP